MFGIGMPEVLIIGVIFLIVFGAGKLPSVMSSLGQGIRDFKNSLTDDDESK